MLRRRSINRKPRIKQSRSDRIFDAVNYTWVIAFTLFVLYPLYVILISSFSDPVEVSLGRVIIFPRGFSLDGYKAVLEDARVFRGFYNSFIYTTFGTILNVACTVLAGYSLSRKDLVGGTAIMFFLVFTMYFQGGLIPTFNLVRSLGLYGTRLVMIIMDLVWIFMIIISRTYFRTTIPDELLEAAKMDGCNDGRFFVSVVLPLSGALTAVLVLFYSVGHWNQFFRALVYLRRQADWPLQLVLRLVLIQQQLVADDPNSVGQISQAAFDRAELVKYALIIVASVPMLVLYPFVQKHFVKGIMIGSVKG